MASLLVYYCKNSNLKIHKNCVYITLNYKYDIKEIYKIYIQKKKTKDKMK